MPALRALTLVARILRMVGRGAAKRKKAKGGGGHPRARSAPRRR